jgi:phosphonate C-P lyase system protein PhnH
MTQSVFRVLLNAMSRPGRIYEMGPFIGGWNCPAPGGFGSGAAFLVPVLRTLLDSEVSFCVTGDKRTAKEIAKFTGSHVSGVGDADFVIVPHGGKSRAVLEAKRGTLKYPDEGATIIFCVERLGEEIEAILRLDLRGPGIADTRRLSIAGIDFETFAHLKEINSEFPLGMDSFFMDKKGRLAAIPRSTAIEEVKKWDT